MSFWRLGEIVSCIEKQKGSTGTGKVDPANISFSCTETSQEGKDDWGD